MPQHLLAQPPDEDNTPEASAKGPMAQCALIADMQLRTGAHLAAALLPAVLHEASSTCVGGFGARFVCLSRLRIALIGG